MHGRTWHLAPRFVAFRFNLSGPTTMSPLPGMLLHSAAPSILEKAPPGLLQHPWKILNKYIAKDCDVVDICGHFLLSITRLCTARHHIDTWSKLLRHSAVGTHNPAQQLLLLSSRRFVLGCTCHPVGTNNFSSCSVAGVNWSENKSVLQLHVDQLLDDCDIFQDGIDPQPDKRC